VRTVPAPRFPGFWGPVDPTGVLRPDLVVAKAPDFRAAESVWQLPNRDLSG